MIFIENMAKVVILVLLLLIESRDGAEFINCDDSLPVQLYFKFDDPLVIILGQPLHITGGALVRKTFPKEFQVKHTMKRRFLGKWWTLPCKGIVGSCVDPMPCEEFIAFGFNGTCPIQPGNYKNYHLQIPVPKFPVPAWLTDGLYQVRVEGYDDSMKEKWFCGQLTQYNRNKQQVLQMCFKSNWKS